MREKKRRGRERSRERGEREGERGIKIIRKREETDVRETETENRRKRKFDQSLSK